MAKSKCRLLSASAEKDGGRFWKKADVRGPDECWLWKASTTRGGYGQFGVGPPNAYRMVSAHRVAYFLGHGVDPGALFVLHRCDEHRCVNPAHLFLGTQLENIRDCVAKGRMRRGEQLTYARLKEIDIVEIRRLWATGTMSQSAIGRKFGVTQGNIWCIVQRKTWAHIA